MNNDQKVLELYFKCINLPITATRLELQHKIQSGWITLGQSEDKNNDRHPQYSKCLRVNYSFSIKKELLINIINIHTNLVYCSALMTLQQIAGAKDQIYQTPLEKDPISAQQYKNKFGTLIIVAQYLKYNNDEIELQLGARQLYQERFCYCLKLSNVHPFVKIYRKINQHHKTVVYQSNVLENYQYQCWNTIVQKMTQFCNLEYDEPLIVEVYDFKSNGMHTYIGYCSVNINQLKQNINQLNIINEINNQSTGILLINHFSINQIPTFEDYIKGGLELNLMIGLDFTDSNGSPNLSSSLHYIDLSGATISPYQQALKQITEILISYDDDKMVPVYGFGGIPYQKEHVSHCFPLNYNPDDPEVHEVDGILSVYKQAVNQVQFSGPTLFAPLFRQATKLAKRYKNEKINKYLILLVITDGVIADYDQTFEMIVDSSQLPLSIIVIGVGNANFNEMEKLNNDDLMEIDQQGRKAERDLLKFVNFSQYQNDLSELNSAVLSELPDQVVQYMMKTNQKPLKNNMTVSNAMRQQIPQQIELQFNQQQSQRSTSNLVFVRANSMSQQFMTDSELQQSHDIHQLPK